MPISDFKNLKQILTAFWICLSINFGRDVFASATLPQPIVYPKEELEIYDGVKNEELTSAVLKKIPGFRDSVMQDFDAQSFPAMLADSENEKRLCEILKEGLDLKSDRMVVARYEQSLRDISPDRFANMFLIKRVYLYERKEITDELKSGGKVPYVQYNAKSEQLVSDAPKFSVWSDSGQPSDYPLVIVYPSKDKSPDELLDYTIMNTLAGFGESFKRLNASAAFEIVDSVVSKTIAAEIPPTPVWFSAGLSDYLDLLFLTSVLGSGPKAIDCVATARLRVTRPKVKVSLADWDPKNFNFSDNGFYRNQASLLFLTIHEGVGRNHDWLKTVVNKLREKAASNAQPLSTDDVAKILQDTSGVNIESLLTKYHEK